MDSSRMILLIFTLLSVGLYLAGGIIHIIKKPSLSKKLVGVGFFSNIAIILIHWIVNDYPPIANMYQLLSVLSFTFILTIFILLLVKKEEEWLCPYFFFTAAVPLIGTLFMKNVISWALQPALRSGFFVPHVFSYMVSYSLAAVAFVLCIEYLILKEKRQKLLNSITLIVRISFPFMVLGLCLGAIWADQIWGNFWQWDIKEIWSLITALLYMSGLHLNYTGKRKISIVFYVIGFLALVITFFFVNIMPNAGSMHTYA